MFCQAFWRNDCLSSFCVPLVQFLHTEMYLSVKWGAESSNAAARIGRRELLQGSVIKRSCCNTLQLEKGEILDAQQKTMSMADFITFKITINCLASLMCYIYSYMKMTFLCMYCLSFLYFIHLKNNAPKNIAKTKCAYFTNKCNCSSLWNVVISCAQITFVCVKPNEL